MTAITPSMRNKFGNSSSGSRSRRWIHRRMAPSAGLASQEGKTEHSSEDGRGSARWLIFFPIGSWYAFPRCSYSKRQLRQTTASGCIKPSWRSRPFATQLLRSSTPRGPHVWEHQKCLASLVNGGYCRVLVHWLKQQSEILLEYGS